MVRELRAVNSIYSLNTLLEESFLIELVSLYQRNLYTKWNEVLLIRISPKFFIWGEGLVHPWEINIPTSKLHMIVKVSYMYSMILSRT